ncbi:YggS family pyridoxal phosphate-dependent enzyme, partial [bacterium]|nr:YggS family pyridoxal phosphate-dependent enzyme [bacterium]
MSDSLEQNYFRLCGEVRQAAEKAGRNPASVRLLAVSKKVPAERLRILWGLGHRLFGENRVQEARVKIPEMPPGGEW